jgi:hypothetical protein
MRRLQGLPRLLRFEAIGSACILMLMALDEYVDLPKILFGEEPTPLRHHEFVMEFTAVCVVAAMAMALSWFADRRRSRLDSLLVVSAGPSGRSVDVDRDVPEGARRYVRHSWPLPCVLRKEISDAVVLGRGWQIALYV